MTNKQKYKSKEYEKFCTELVVDAPHPSSKVETIDKKLESLELTFTDTPQSTALTEFSLENFYDWFRGFRDAEGSFNIYCTRNKFYSFSFQIKLHIDDINVLYYIQKTLGIGKVYKSKSSPSCKFIVYKQSEVRKIVTIFSNCTLNSSKSLNFIGWVEAFNLYTENQKSDHAQLEKELIFSRIESIKAEMNTNRTDWKRIKDINITPYWLQGFVEGDGSFCVGKDNYLLIFSIAQTLHDLPLMEAIKNYLNSQFKWSF